MRGVVEGWYEDGEGGEDERWEVLFVVSSVRDDETDLGSTNMAWYLHNIPLASISHPYRRRKLTHLKKIHAQSLNTKDDAAVATLAAASKVSTAIEMRAIEDQA